MANYGYVRVSTKEQKTDRQMEATNRYSDLVFQPNYESNAFLKRLKALLTLKMIPEYLMPLYSEFSAVDQTAVFHGYVANA